MPINAWSLVTCLPLSIWSVKNSDRSIIAKSPTSDRKILPSRVTDFSFDWFMNKIDNGFGGMLVMGTWLVITSSSSLWVESHPGPDNFHIWGSCLASLPKVVVLPRCMLESSSTVISEKCLVNRTIDKLLPCWKWYIHSCHKFWTFSP